MDKPEVGSFRINHIQSAGSHFGRLATTQSIFSTLAPGFLISIDHLEGWYTQLQTIRLIVLTIQSIDQKPGSKILFFVLFGFKSEDHFNLVKWVDSHPFESLAFNQII